MDGARWKQVQQLFHEAADLPAAQQREYVDRASAGDSALAADVMAMLEEDRHAASLLDDNIARIAGDLFGPEDAPTGQFGPYRILRLLGEGGMGTVYLAEREDLGNLVAIKILRDGCLSPARRERFAAEQRTLAQLNHPSIARIYDADVLPDGTPWFVMEYVAGEPLTLHCRRSSCSLNETMQLFRMVCEAVQFAHQHAIIHRDLKPSNIFATETGGVKLLDFGIAKQIDVLDDSADLTRTGLRLMTPAYAAPEQIRGDRVGVHTDVYSLGVVLYELLAGCSPFDLSSRAPGEAERVLLESEVQRPSSRRPDRDQTAAWGDLDVLCLTAMHRDVDRRYRSVEALLRDVDHYLKGEPLDARPDTVQYRAGKFIRRHRRAVVAAVALFVVVIGMATFFTIRLAKARNEALAEAARTQRIQRFMLNLFDGGDKTAGPATDLRVLTLVQRGVQEARALDREPAVQAELFETLGGIYQKLGDLAKADSLFRQALDQRKALLGADHYEVGRTMVSLGLLRADQAQLEEAERLVKDGMAITSRVLPATHPTSAKGLSAYGQILEQRGNYAEAIRVLDQAVSLQSAGEETSADLAESLYELANTHFYAGHLAEAEALTRRVMAMHQKLYGERHPMVADDLVNLGAVRFELGKYNESEEFYRKALTITEAWFGADHFKTASNLTMLARNMVRQDRLSEASELLQRVTGIQERVFGPNHPRVASALNELGTVALLRKQLDEAEAVFRRTGDIYRSVHGDRHFLFGVARSNLGSVFLARKDYAKAEPLFREAVACFTEVLSESHLNTGIARIKLGRALVRQRKYEEAETQLMGGYQILRKQTTPSITFLKAAREDLITLYDARNQPEKAAPFRAELAASKPVGQ